MARGVATPGESVEAVERESREKHPEFRIVRVTKLDLSDHPVVQRGSMQDNWYALVFEDPDPDGAPFPQQDDPEGEALRGLLGNLEDVVRQARQARGEA